MAGDNRKNDENYLRTLAFLKRKALDVKFDIDTTQYKPLENIGIGAYGVVCSAIHRKANDRVAIKKIPNVFAVKDVAKRTYREIRILKHFVHDNIIHIREILKPRETLQDFRDVYVVFDLMESDLHKIIYSKQELTEEHVRYFLYQILRGLKYIHSAHVIHRDLKPSNLLVNEDCQLRIGDFGMARGFSSSPSDSGHFMTQYVATRYYRAPEIMLSLIEYGAAVDMWSVGCIFAEMLGRKHLFPGKNSVDQMKLIVGCLGTPDSNLLEMCQSPIIRSFFQEMGHKEPVPWVKLYPKASKKAINFLSRMLVLNPKDRITVDQALVHPFLNKYHDPDDEPICLPPFNFDFEKEDLSTDQLRHAIHKEIMEYHEPRTPTFSFNAELTPVPKSPLPQLNKPDIKPELTHVQPQIMVSETHQVMTTINAQNSLLKPNDDDLFKRPLSAKKEPEVKVKTEDLKTDVSDVEMLSARSTDERQPMSATVTEEGKMEKKENEEPIKDDKNKTISEGTKNLIKAALLNASFKKRTDSVGEEDRPKPITAAMRQKEREDKRKKKKEKNLERKRKEKKKNEKTDELLTSEDKELLQRWTKMQQVNVPIAPKPRSDSIGQGQGLESGISNQGQGDSSTSGGQGQSVFCSNMRNVQQETLDLLQQRILGNSGTGKQGSDKSHLSNTQNSHTSLLDSNSGHRVHPVLKTSQTCADSTLPQTTAIATAQPGGKGPGDTNSGGNFSVNFSGVPLGDLDFLSMVTSPDIANLLSENISEEINQAAVSTNQPQFSQSSNMNYTGMNQIQTQPTFSDENSPDFLQSLCSETNPARVDVRRTSGHFVPQDCAQEGSGSQINVSPTYKNHLSPSHFSQVQETNTQANVSPSQSISPQYFNQPSNAGPATTTQQMTSAGQQQIFSFVNPPNVLPEVGHLQASAAANIPFQDSGVRLDNNQTDPSTLFMSSRDSQGNQSLNQPQRNFHYRNQSTGSINLQEVKESQNSSSNSNSPPPLTVNTRNAQLSFQNIFQSPVPGPSHAGNQLDVNDTQIDLVALLTKQLSKSNVEDLCPTLALTPRGTGAGYGLGVDLESLMNTGDPEG